MRLSDIEKVLIKDNVILNGADRHIDYLMDKFNMPYEVAVNTYANMCDWYTPHFNIIISWVEVLPKENITYIKDKVVKTLSKIVGDRDASR